MAKIVLETYIIATLICLAYGGSWQFGRCPYVRLQEDFNVSEALGHWYEYAKYPIPTEVLSKCITFDLNQLSDGNIGLLKTLRGSVTGIQTGITGNATVVAPGVLNVAADGIVGLLGSNNIKVLGTDYSNYAVNFVCQDAGFGIFHIEHAFIITRDSQPSANVINSAKRVLRNNGLSVQALVNTDQVNCPENH